MEQLQNPLTNDLTCIEILISKTSKLNVFQRLTLRLVYLKAVDIKQVELKELCLTKALSIIKHFNSIS